MTIRAGASLPGPLFISVPVGGPLIGLLAVALIPLLLMIWLVQAMFWLCWIVTRELVIPATRGAITAANVVIDEDRQRQLTPSTRRGISAEDRALLRKLGM